MVTYTFKRGEYLSRDQNPFIMGVNPNIEGLLRFLYFMLRGIAVRDAQIALGYLNCHTRYPIEAYIRWVREIIISSKSIYI